MSEKTNEQISVNNIINESKDLFYIITYPNNSSRNIYSDNVQSIIGYTPSELESMPDKLYSLVQSENAIELKKSLSDFQQNKTKSGESFIYKINHKDGNEIWLNEIVTLNRDKKGEIINRSSIFCNITNIKSGESVLINNINFLKELNASKDKFISIVTHDLRAPFTTLLGFSEILLNEKDISEEERDEYIKYIYDASKTQLNLINCLLDWSRLQTGRIKVEPTRLNVKSAIAAAIAPLTGDAVRKNIDVKIEIPADLYITADERLIGQAVVNLTSNAIKYTPNGKEVHIFSQRFKEGMIEIVVRDEGLGISDENQNKLFRIDQKFSLAGTEGEKGTGLGLMLMKEIVEKHGGQVWFYSQENQGSEFHFTVPEAKNLILIVEADPSIQEFYKSVIGNNFTNIEAATVSNGYEAISHLKNLIPTILITNHDMPLMNGIQLVEALNKRESSRSIPVIVVSSKLDDEFTRSYSKLGVTKIILKPIDSDQLIEKIKECLF